MWVINRGSKLTQLKNNAESFGRSDSHLHNLLGLPISRFISGRNVRTVIEYLIFESKLPTVINAQ